MLKAIFGGSRFVVSLAVIGAFLGSVVLLVAATLTVFRLAWEVVLDLRGALVAFPNGDSDLLVPRHVEHLGVQFVQLTDIVLLGVVMYIVAVGLYQLFIDRRLPVPSWLRVHDLVELKRDLISVTVVLLGVTYLGVIVEWNPGNPGEPILFVGAGIALVVGALGLILWLTPAPAKEESPQPPSSGEGERSSTDVSAASPLDATNHPATSA